MNRTRTDLLEELFQLSLRQRMDPRSVGYDVRASFARKTVLVSGFTMMNQTDFFVRQLASTVFVDYKVEFDLLTLRRNFRQVYRRVAIPDVDLKPVDRTIDSSPASYGDVLCSWFEREGRVFAQHANGLFGYISARSTQEVSVDDYIRWKNGPCAVFLRAETFGETSVPAGSRLVMQNGKVQLCSGEWVSPDKESLAQVNPQQPEFFERIRQHVERFSGAMYLWGGKTHLGLDCSALAQALFFHAGIRLPRDSSMQALYGETTGYLADHRDLLPGDLVFFVKKTGRVYHVGVYEGEHSYIHICYRRPVTHSSFLKAGSNYMDRFTKSYAFAKRLRPCPLPLADLQKK